VADRAAVIDWLNILKARERTCRSTSKRLDEAKQTC